MDETTEQIDPLAALREADHRSSAERLREWLRAQRRGAVASSTDSWSALFADEPDRAVRPTSALRLLPLLIVLLALVAAYVLPRLAANSGHPVEDTLPLAQISDRSAVQSPTASASTIQVGPAQPTRVVVHVAGSVLEPGLVVGDSTWRVADAIEAAGGVAGTADLDRVNLAAFVVDASRIYVPSVDELSAPVVVSNSDGSAVSGDSTNNNVTINLNTADAASLEQLPGVGPATAQAILAHREEHGPFGSVDGLVAVTGIGPARLETMRPHATV